ncbi:hypothetical protein SAMN04489712_106235 [Thermomonospora echinospora]|uniref:Uncharacterized protein n=1 Tax=Thermomonospora echinospora TaxID=1992 RepID=A0A1H6B4K8_9ACTN|nr:hypothetical protein SAMN04489712_106235 [Thermomonospora echinospora]
MTGAQVLESILEPRRRKRGSGYAEATGVHEPAGDV